MRLLVLFALAAVLAVPVAWGDDWGDVAVVSRTLGVQADRLCLGEGTRHDIGCPDYAPYVSATSGNVGIGMLPPDKVAGSPNYRLAVSGSLLVAVSNTSGGLNIVNNSKTGADQGLRWAINNMTGNYGDSLQFWVYDTAACPDGICAPRLILTDDGRMTVGGDLSSPTSVRHPKTTLEVRGAIRIAADTSATMAVCDADRAGAIRYVSGAFQVCYGSGGWAGLADTSGTAVVADRIVSGTSSAVIGPDGTVTMQGVLDIVTRTSVVAVGNGAASNTSASAITAVGVGAAQYVSNTLGGSAYVTAVGHLAGQYHSGYMLGAFGYTAGRFNTGMRVTALGNFAGGYNTGSSATIVGHAAGQYNSGDYLVTVGHRAAMYNSGTQVVGVGYEANYANTGDYVTAVGNFAGSTNTFNNSTLLGYNAQADKANQVVLGNGQVVEVSTSGVVAAAGVSTTGNAYISGTLQISGKSADSCGPGKYGTLKIVDGRIWMCRKD